MSAKCGTCRFHESWEKGVGRCHFNPPAQVHDVRNEYVEQWPLVRSAVDWCGRYEISDAATFAHRAPPPQAVLEDEF